VKYLLYIYSFKEQLSIWNISYLYLVNELAIVCWCKIKRR